MAMSPLFRRIPIALLALTLAGCYGQPVHHYSSDVCLLLPGQTTRQEVLAYLGTPDQRRLDPQKGETWIYYQVHKSFLRKMPYVGGTMGQERYDVVKVTFRGDRVETCAYRSFGEKEFKRAGLAGSESSDS